MMKTLAAIAFFTATAFGADVTGKWVGTFGVQKDGDPEQHAAYLDLKQNGAKLTGLAGPDLDKMLPIEAGVIEGNKIKFTVSPPEGSPIHFELTIEDDRITGDASGEEAGSPRRAKLDVKRAPPSN